MSLKIKDATLIEELADYLMFAVGNTEGDTDGAVTLGQVKDYTDTDKALVAFTGSYLNLSDAPNLESYVLMDTLTQNYYNRNQVNQLIGGVSGPKFEKVEELPEQGENNVIYLIPDETAQQDNIFDEYIWIPDGRMFEKIGSTAADFENYYTIEEVDAMIPSVNNPTITFQQGGVTKGTITLNQSSASTINFDESFEQEQADWNQSNPAAADYIKNKPNIPVVNDTIMTISQGGVQKGIFSLNQEGPETIDLDAQVQADWDQEDNSEADYIKNKPDILELIFKYEDNTGDLVDFYIKDSVRIYDYFYIKNEYEGQNTITVGKDGASSGSASNTVEYSKDRKNWTTITINNNSPVNIVIEDGETIWFRNDNGYWNWMNENNNRACNYFRGSQIYSAGGNLMSLVKYTNMDGFDISGRDGLFSKLFLGTENSNNPLISVSNLVFPEQISKQCYAHMFEYCTSLTSTPSFLETNTVLADRCYMYMFKYCTSLTDIPQILPATELAESCYACMFWGCNALTTVQTTLPATTLVETCYDSMFRMCRNLTTAPALPATALADRCYMYMFQGCTSLTTAPVLPATTLASSCYVFMFFGCSSLTTAPVLPAETPTSNCYENMFTNCTSLNYIEVKATSWNYYFSEYWVENVSSTGTFVKPSSTTIPSGINGIPYGWTVTNV